MKMLFATATETVAEAGQDRSTFEQGNENLSVRGTPLGSAVPAILFLFLAIKLQYATEPMPPVLAVTATRRRTMLPA